MATRLLLLADTHVPKRARDLPAEVWRAVEEADLVVHAGDWVDVRLLDELEARSARLVACWGNNDHGELRERLPEVARVEVEGVRLGVVHETGQAKGREERMSVEHADLDVLVFGHSHIPWDTVTATGLRLLNPGSPTDRRRQPHCTYLTATAEDGGSGTSSCTGSRHGRRHPPEVVERARSRPDHHPAHRDERRTERQEAQVPGERAAEVVAHVVHTEQLVVDEALDDVEATPAGEQPADVETPARRQPPLPPLGERHDRGPHTTSTWPGGRSRRPAC